MLSPAAATPNGIVNVGRRGELALGALGRAFCIWENLGPLQGSTGRTPGTILVVKTKDSTLLQERKHRKAKPRGPAEAPGVSIRPLWSSRAQHTLFSNSTPIETDTIHGCLQKQWVDKAQPYVYSNRRVKEAAPFKASLESIVSPKASAASYSILPWQSVSPLDRIFAVTVLPHGGRRGLPWRCFYGMEVI